MLLGNRIKTLRLEKKMTQQELGDILNVTKVSIHCYETGKRVPTIDTIVDLSNIFGVDINYLLGTDNYVIEDKSSEYGIKMSKEEVEFIKLIRNNNKLYKYLIDDPKRFIELIKKKLL